MTPTELVAYLAPALGFTAVLATLLFLLGRRLLPGIDGRHLLTLFLSLFFLTLTQHPLPDSSTLDCSSGGVAPLLRPFAFLDRYGLLWHRGSPPKAWFGDKIVQASSMNFLLCAAIGAASVRHMRGRRPVLRATIFGAFLSILAEITQATAFFGLYPCPYRYFEIDDLILNIAGTFCGALVYRLHSGTTRQGST